MHTQTLMEEGNPASPVALIVGVTGMVGIALTEALNKPTALGGPWTVYGVSRRSLPPWFPSSLLNNYLILDTLNQEETQKLLSPLSSKVTHLFWVAISVNESEEVNISLNSTMLSNVLNTLTSSQDSKLRHVTLQTGTKQYMGPVFDPSLSAKLVPHDPPFREDYPRIPFPNFYYALEDIVASYPKSFTYSIHRSSIIIGASSRSFFNELLTLSVYALICILAISTAGNTFGMGLWRVLCDAFDVEFVPFDENEKFDFVDYMKDKEEVWDRIVEENGLYKTKLKEITCVDASNAILKFEFQHVCSMNKSREFGFLGFENTLASIVVWVERLKQMNILP
ncbi:unnamed protein product [Lactuca saligna]|uniref:PRISE-like Rossmann-fold domain-containing protein n=1 Tax=Lactuca saligna TaxID=75948 RepID=A0AA35VL73_LACSI|nr:unnamed protein product [Lactuca saligna]